MKKYRIKGRLTVTFDVTAPTQSKASVIWRELMEEWKKKGYSDSEDVEVGAIQEFNLDEIEES